MDPARQPPEELSGLLAMARLAEGDPLADDDRIGPDDETSPEAGGDVLRLRPGQTAGAGLGLLAVGSRADSVLVQRAGMDAERQADLSEQGGPSGGCRC